MIPEDCFYTQHHVWVKPDDDTQLLGVTEPLLRRIGAVVGVEMLDADDPIMPDIPLGALEGMRETRQLYLPMEADILEVNDELVWDFTKLEKDPYGEGWLIKIKASDVEQLDDLMTHDEYDSYIEDQAEEDEDEEEEDEDFDLEDEEEY